MAVKVKLVEAPMPKGKGLKVVITRFVKIKFLQSHYIIEKNEKTGKLICLNDARATTLSERVIQAFQDLIKMGYYEKDHHIPPVVIKISETEYIMVSGEHRLTAHMRAGKTEMWVAICEFVATDGKTAGYWKRKYQSNENNPAGRMMANSRTDEDIISIVKADIREGDYKITDRPAILQSLIDQHIKVEKKREDLANRVINEVAPEIPNIPKSRNKRETAALILQCKNDKEIDFNGEVPEHIVKNATVDIWEDYVDRIIRAILANVVDGILPKSPVALHYSGMNGKDTKKARTNAINFFYSAIERAYTLVKLVKTGEFQKQVDVHIVSQFAEEPVPYVEQSIKLNFPKDVK